MERDYSALASRVAARAEVLGCLILSRDGLVLGSFPPGGEQDTTAAWLRFSSIGEPERGFIAFAHQQWAYTKHGEYAAFAVAVPSARAGILLDLLEQALMEVDEARNLRAAVRAPQQVNLTYPAPREEVAPRLPTAEEAAAPVSLPPSPPHRLDDRAQPVEAPAGSEAPSDVPVGAGASPSDGPVRSEGQPAEPTGAPEDAPSYAPAAPEGSPQGQEVPPEPEPGRAPEDIDRVALAREFAELLQENPRAVEEEP
jgi:hypothetical protein